MKRLLYTIPLFAAAALTAACEDFASADPDQAVVEGYLHAGRTPEIRINRQLVIAEGDTTYDNPLSGLTLTLLNETTGRSETLSESADEAGTYLGTSAIEAEATYRLSFEYAGKQVWAETTVPSAVEGFWGEADFIVHTASLADDTVRYVNFHWQNPDNVYHLTQMTHMETWTKLLNEYNPSPKKTITSTPTLDTTYQVSSRAFSYYGRHYVIVYKVNEEYVNLYYESSSNSQHLTNPATNVHNGYGILTGMNSDTLLLRVL
jgi:hypothetical protein